MSTPEILLKEVLETVRKSSENRVELPPDIVENFRSAEMDICCFGIDSPSNILQSDIFRLVWVHVVKTPKKDKVILPTLAVDAIRSCDNHLRKLGTLVIAQDSFQRAWSDIDYLGKIY
jgi:hypothetical protein